MNESYAAPIQPIVASVMKNMCCSVCRCVCVFSSVDVCVLHAVLSPVLLINWLTESAELAEPTLGNYTHTHTLRHAHKSCMLHTCTLTCSQTWLGYYTLALTLLGGCVVCTNQRYCHGVHIFLSAFINRPVTDSHTDRCNGVLPVGL